MSPAPLDPHQLACRSARGDTEATAQLLRLVAPEVLRVVRGVMGPHAADVDDAVQQALIALIHALPSFRGECAPAGFACRIAFRTALSVRRKAQRARQRTDCDTDADELASPGGLHLVDDTSRRTEVLRSLLDSLPPEQAEALALRTMLGFSLEEIAQASEVPVNTVRSRLRLAKEALRRRIERSPTIAEELGVQP